MQFSGRVEALIKVPAAGAAVSASNSGGGASLATAPSGGYFLTNAGLQASLLSTLQAQLNASRPPASGSWTVSLGADGRVSIGCTGSSAVPSFSVDWVSTTLRDLLGFTRNINYASSATELAADLGYGLWTSGASYLLNESSGSAASVFGSPASLAPNGTPTYNNQGPRGGSDKAIGFDAGSENFDGGNVFDVTGADDLIVKWVGFATSAPAANRALISKFTGTGWHIEYRSNGTIVFIGTRSGPTTDFQTASFTLPTGVWYEGIAVIDRSTNRARLGVRTLAGGTTVSAEIATTAAASYSTAANFRIGRRADSLTDADTGHLFAEVSVVSGPGVAAGLSANLSAALSNAVATFGTWTGTQQARGVWYPDSPIFVADSDPRRAPLRSDARTAVTSTGASITHVGVYRRQHRIIRWDAVPIDRISESSATYANASFDTFWSDTQLAHGPISWFRAGSRLLIVDEGGRVMGEDMQAGGPTEGWAVTNIDAVEPRRNDPNGWTGRWTVEIPELIAKDA